MRFFLKYMITPFAAAFAAANICAAQQVLPEREPATFLATFETGPDKVLMHRVGEWVAIYDGINSEANVFRITAFSDGKYTLTGNISKGAKNLMAICPYAKDAVIPVVQSIPTGKPIDPAANVATAIYDGKQFSFKNVSSFVKFTITGDKVTRVTLQGKKRVLRVDPAGPYFKKGTYFAAVAPGVWSGLTLISQADDLTRWINEPSKKLSLKKNAVESLDVADTGNILLGKWNFTPEIKSSFSGFSGRSKTPGNAGKVLVANSGGKAVIDFFQNDINGRGGKYAKRKINDKGQPEANYVWKGDYWRFRARNVNLPAGTKIHIKFLTRVSGRGMKYWRLEAWDGKEWVNPESSYGKAVEAEGETYSFVNTPDGEKVECTWTLSSESTEVEFRMVCASNWSYKVEDGPGILSEPISASCVISDVEPFMEAILPSKLK